VSFGAKTFPSEIFGRARSRTDGPVESEGTLMRKRSVMRLMTTSGSLQVVGRELKLAGMLLQDLVRVIAEEEPAVLPMDDLAVIRGLTC
jgi:hypothetical protein